VLYLEVEVAGLSGASGQTAQCPVVGGPSLVLEYVAGGTLAGKIAGMCREFHVMSGIVLWGRGASRWDKNIQNNQRHQLLDPFPQD